MSLWCMWSALKEEEKEVKKKSREKSREKNLGGRKNSRKEKLRTKFVGTYWAPYGREMVIFKRLFFWNFVAFIPASLKCQM